MNKQAQSETLQQCRGLAKCRDNVTRLNYKILFLDPNQNTFSFPPSLTAYKVGETPISLADYYKTEAVFQVVEIILRQKWIYPISPPLIPNSILYMQGYYQCRYKLSVTLPEKSSYRHTSSSTKYYMQTTSDDNYKGSTLHRHNTSLQMMCLHTDPLEALTCTVGKCLKGTFNHMKYP